MKSHTLVAYIQLLLIVKIREVWNIRGYDNRLSRSFLVPWLPLAEGLLSAADVLWLTYIGIGREYVRLACDMGWSWGVAEPERTRLKPRCWLFAHWMVFDVHYMLALTLYSQSALLVSNSHISTDTLADKSLTIHLTTLVEHCAVLWFGLPRTQDRLRMAYVYLEESVFLVLERDSCCVSTTSELWRHRLRIFYRYNKVSFSITLDI